MMTPELRSAHLLTLKLQVDFAGMLSIGSTAQGRRRIAPITGGAFEGTRLQGEVLPGGADWVLNRADGHMAIDVRIALKPQDGGLIYCTYQGLFQAASPDLMAKFDRGGRLEADDYRVRTVVRFETGAKSLQWLNDLLAIGVGRQTESGPIYEVFEIL